MKLKDFVVISGVFEQLYYEQHCIKKIFYTAAIKNDFQEPFYVFTPWKRVPVDALVVKCIKEKVLKHEAAAYHIILIKDL